MARKARALGVEDWLMAGFRALAANGPAAVRAEALARALATTKGSFYWHFADVADYRRRLLAHWEQRAFTDIVARVEAEPDPRARLRLLCTLAVSFRDPEYGGTALEPALRAWAKDDRQVAEAVLRVDAQRMAYLHALCAQAGLPEPLLPRLIYAATIGLEMLAGGDSETDAAAMLLLLDAIGGTTPAASSDRPRAAGAPSVTR